VLVPNTARISEGAPNPIRIVQIENLAPRRIHTLVARVGSAHGESRKHMAFQVSEIYRTSYG